MKISKLLLTGLMIISSALLFGQSKTVTGTVTAEDSGETLPGATVVVEGTTNGLPFPTWTVNLVSKLRWARCSL